jgi:hypothetical protein
VQNNDSSKQQPRNGKKDERRPGSWAEVEVLEDPASHIGLVLSERIRGKPGYAFRIVHFDEQGLNPYVPLRPSGAKNELKDIVSSLVSRALEIMAEREAKAAGTTTPTDPPPP